VNAVNRFVYEAILLDHEAIPLVHEENETRPRKTRRDRVEFSQIRGFRTRAKGAGYWQAWGNDTYVCPSAVSDPSEFVSWALGIAVALNHEYRYTCGFPSRYGMAASMYACWSETEFVLSQQNSVSQMGLPNWTNPASVAFPSMYACSDGRSQLYQWTAM
jgi:hypothetical protein